jgi:hypothetical protein
MWMFNWLWLPVSLCGADAEVVAEIELLGFRIIARGVKSPHRVGARSARRKAAMDE